MKSLISFIGAGKVGSSFGKYLSDRGCKIIGYFSKSRSSAREAAEITHSSLYETVKDLVLASNIVFITARDESIVKILETAVPHANENTCFCYCSGALSCEEMPFSCCSLHPLIAVPDKHSPEVFSDCIFTLEGRDSYFGTQRIYDLMRSAGNRVIRLRGENKTLYHAACVTASNLVIGLLDEAIELLTKCGFDRDTAFEALLPLFSANVSAVKEKGIKNALTGPIERNDILTVEKHLKVLDQQDDKTLYRILSQHVLAIAKQRNPENDYTLMKEILK